MCPVVWPGLTASNAEHQRFVRHVDQPFGLAVDFAHRIHAARVAVPAIDDQRDVDVDDVAFTQRFRAGNAVTDDMIDQTCTGNAYSRDS